jgi:hypothetical protein
VNKNVGRLITFLRDSHNNLPQSGIVQIPSGLATCLYDAEMLVWMTLSGVCGIVEASY